jgi:uncharacterized C2H2 Zn-finger protein
MSSTNTQSHYYLIENDGYCIKPIQFPWMRRDYVLMEESDAASADSPSNDKCTKGKSTAFNFESMSPVHDSTENSGGQWPGSCYVHEPAKENDSLNCLSVRLYNFIKDMNINPFFVREIPIVWITVCLGPLTFYLFILSIPGLTLFDWCQTNKGRPRHILCSTMPWSICPALAVLWGVCWMFINTGNSNPQHVIFEPSTDLDFSTFDNVDWSFMDQESRVPFGIHINTCDLSNHDIPTSTLFPTLNSEVHSHIGSNNSATGTDLGSVRGTSTVVQQQALVPTPQPPISDRLFRCRRSNCQKTFQSAAGQRWVSYIVFKILSILTIEFRAHEKRHDRQYQCPECSRNFGARKDLGRHQTTVHRHLAPFQCNVPNCPRGKNPFGRLDNLVRHMKNAHGQLSIISDGSLKDASAASSAEIGVPTKRQELQAGSVICASPQSPIPQAVNARQDNAVIQDEATALRAQVDTLTQELHVQKNVVKVLVRRIAELEAQRMGST